MQKAHEERMKALSDLESCVGELVVLENHLVHGEHTHILSHSRNFADWKSLQPGMFKVRDVLWKRWWNEDLSVRETRPPHTPGPYTKNFGQYDVGAYAWVFLDFFSVRFQEWRIATTVLFHLSPVVRVEKAISQDGSSYIKLQRRFPDVNSYLEVLEGEGIDHNGNYGTDYRDRVRPWGIYGTVYYPTDLMRDPPEARLLMYYGLFEKYYYQFCDGSPQGEIVYEIHPFIFKKMNGRKPGMLDKGIMQLCRDFFFPTLK